MSDATYSVTDNGDLHRYRTEIPNIVFRLGLSPYELALYAHLKQTAGDGGQCWKSTSILARETGMSAGMVSKAKEGLTCPRRELDGNALVTVRQEQGTHGGKPRDHVTFTEVQKDASLTGDNWRDMPAQFWPETAADIGLHEAIVLADIQWRLKIGRGVQDAGGVPGVYYPRAEIVRAFPYLTYQGFCEAIFSLTDQEITDYADRQPEGFLVWLDDRSGWSTEGNTQVDTSAPAKVFTEKYVGRPGYVYILKSQDGLYKIGKSVDPEVRIRSMGVLLPFAIEPIHFIPSDDYSEAESILHRRFTGQRVRGEWFQLDASEVEWLLSLTEL